MPTCELLNIKSNYTGLAPAIADIGSNISMTAKTVFAVPLSYYAVQRCGIMQVSHMYINFNCDIVRLLFLD